MYLCEHAGIYEVVKKQKKCFLKYIFKRNLNKLNKNRNLLEQIDDGGK